MTWDGKTTPDQNTPDWNAFLNSSAVPQAASSAGTVASEAEALPAHSPNNSPSGMSAFMAPYMQQAHQIFGQNPVFGNSNFGKTRLGAGLTAAVEAGTQARAGATIGDSIGVASRMLMAPGQYNRQVALDENNYVQQKTMQNLTAQKDISQINENNARTAYMTGAQSDLADARAQRLKEGPAAKVHFGPAEQQADGSWLQPTYDNVTGQQLGMQKVPGRVRTPVGNPNSDYDQAGIIRRLNDPSPSVRAQAKIDQEQFESMSGALAANRAAGTNSVTGPVKDQERFLANEKQMLLQNHPKPLDQDRWETTHMTDKGFDFANTDAGYKKYTDDIQSQIDDRNTSFSRYENGNSWKNGIGYNDWKNGKTSSPSTNNPPSSGATWQPPK
jgi:hypothetical protein